MGFIKLIFVLLIVFPVAIFMFFLYRKLVKEYNDAMRKERNIKSGKYERDKERKRFESQPDYVKNNPQYYEYRRRLDEKNKKER